MIVTVTMNPSIDTRYSLDTLTLDDVNRVQAHKTAGGKGINVARVLQELGSDVCAMGLAGGCMGALLEKLMDADGTPHEFTHIAGETRTCVAVLHEGKQTELLEAGPEVANDELEAFTSAFARALAQAEVVTMSGSLPRGVDPRYYVRLIEEAHKQHVPVLLDTSSPALDYALESDVKPFLIKPNLSEVNAMLHTSFTPHELDQLADTIEADARFEGISWVVISMGKDGLFALHNGMRVRLHVAPISAVNATGSGDSTIAGFAYALTKQKDPIEVLKYGATCGTLNALEAKTGYINCNNWAKIYDGCRVEEL